MRGSRPLRFSSCPLSLFVCLWQAAVQATGRGAPKESKEWQQWRQGVEDATGTQIARYYEFPVLSLVLKDPIPLTHHMLPRWLTLAFL